PQRTSCEDYELYLRIARRFPICCHDHISMEYRQHPSGMSRNAARMLRNAMAVLRAQRAYVRAHPAYAAAYREGWHRTQYYYGEQVVNSLRCMLREGQWQQAASGLVTLARYYPQAIPKHLTIKLSCLARRIGAGLRFKKR